jgi:protein tyrosine phosphatase (PTP) superfamily phosphohydrolase (DUF442 family)
MATATRAPGKPGKRPPARRAGTTAGTIARFLGYWLSIGFALGTLILLFPVRWWTSYCRAHSLAGTAESVGVIVMIIILAVVSGLVAFRAARSAAGWGWPGRIALTAVLMVLAGGAYMLWINPAMLSKEMGKEETSAQFVFGPYPTEERLEELKRDGYTVVSLLHPAVVPFEPKLLADEKALAAKIGIPFIHVPMLPWVSQNTAAIDTIKKLASDHSKHYYVHCYLGKDRVQIVKHVVEKSGGSVAALTESRRIAEMQRFERGSIFPIGTDGYVTPYPTDEELGSYIVGGGIKQVVALLDPNNPDDLDRINHEREILTRYEVPFEVIPVSGKYDEAIVTKAVERVHQLPKPVVVHGFFAADDPKGKWAAGFRAKY